MLFKDIKLNDRFILSDQDNPTQISTGKVWNIVYYPQSKNHLTIVHFDDGLGCAVYGGFNEPIHNFMNYLGG